MTTVDTARRGPKEAAQGSSRASGEVRPINEEAERSVVGAVLVDPTRLEMASYLRAGDFASPSLGHCWDAILTLAERGEPITVVTLAERLRQGGLLDDVGGPQALLAIQRDGAATYAVQRHALLIAELSRYRKLQDIGVQISAAALARNEKELVRLVEEATGSEFPTETTSALSLQSFLQAEETEYDWVVPRLIERGDRVILTGLEGKGKSTLLRQFLVTTGAGLHPFSFEPIEPIASVLVDCENSRKHLRRTLRPLSLKVAKELSEGSVHVISRPQGIDLLDPVDAAWLSAEVRRLDPDLILIGPLYKLAVGDPCEEEVAATVAKRLDELRVAAGCALILEAHSPHPSGNSSKRPTRPYGASLWMRWPEFGLHLEESGELQHWRGDRDERDWPQQLRRGGEWPWSTDEHGIGVGADILRFLIESGREVTGNQLHDGLRTINRGHAKATVLRTAADLVATGQIHGRSGAGNAVLYSAPRTRLEAPDEDF